RHLPGPVETEAGYVGGADLIQRTVPCFGVVPAIRQPIARRGSFEKCIVDPLGGQRSRYARDQGRQRKEMEREGTPHHRSKGKTGVWPAGTEGEFAASVEGPA